VPHASGKISSKTMSVIYSLILYDENKKLLYFGQVAIYEILYVSIEHKSDPWLLIDSIRLMNVAKDDFFFVMQNNGRKSFHI
jgi:hypothetical protein